MIRKKIEPKNFFIKFPNFVLYSVGLVSPTSANFILCKTKVYASNLKFQSPWRVRYQLFGEIGPLIFSYVI